MTSGARDDLPDDPIGARGRLETAGVVVLASGIVLRCVVGVEPFPCWADDPLVSPAPVVGLTPTGSLVVDLFMLAAAAMIFLASRRSCGLPAVALALGGVAAVVWHAADWRGLTRVGGGFAAVQVENLVKGSMWVSAILAGLAAGELSGRGRRMMMSVLLGTCAVLGAKGITQVLIEHPRMLENFSANRGQFFAAKGWTEDSPLARAFVRRMEQREATGWWGLANVYASVAATNLTILAGLGWWCWRSRRISEGVGGEGVGVPRSVCVLVMVGAALAAGCVVIAGAKGGFAAGGLGLILVAWFAVRNRGLTEAPAGVGRGRNAWGLIGIGLPVAVLGLVLLRGVIGERIGELSIWFRAFYLEGAARIIAESPVAGVGPDGFQAAYSIAKPDLSPENVSSPHSVFVDFIATLGVGGWCWAALILSWAWRCGCGLATRVRDGGDGPSLGELRPEVRLVALCLAAATLVGAWLESAAGSGTAFLVRLIGLVCGVALGGAALVVLRSAPGFMASVAAAGGLVMLTHSQIELTGVTAGAAAWLFVLLGLGAGGGSGSGVVGRGDVGATGAHAGTGARGRAGWAGVLASILVAIGVAACMSRVGEWEGRIRAAGEAVDGVPEAGDIRREQEAARRGGGGSSADELRRRAGDLLGGAGAGSPSLEAALDRYRFEAVVGARGELGRARGLLPLHFGTAQALSRVMLQLVEQDRGGVVSDAGRGELDRAEGEISRFLEHRPAHGGAWAWLATIRAARADLEGDRSRLDGAAEAWRRAAACDPHNPMHRYLAARVLAARGDREGARIEAAESLRLSELQRLDPLQQLTGAQVGEMRAIVGP